MRSYWQIWLLTIAWFGVLILSTWLIILVIPLISATAWAVIGWSAGFLAFTAFIAFSIWIDQGRNS